MEKIKTWLLKNWRLVIGAVIVLVVGMSVYGIFHRSSAEREKLDAKKTAEVIALKMEKQKILGELKAEKSAKLKIKSDLDAALKREPKTTIKTITEIKTITVDKIEYVPKTEYIKVYEAQQFSLAIRQKYQDYLDVDVPFMENVDRLVKHFESIDQAQNEQIENLRALADKYRRQARRRLMLGAFFGYGGDHDGRFGVVYGVGLVIRIL